MCVCVAVFATQIWIFLLLFALSFPPFSAILCINICLFHQTRTSTLWVLTPTTPSMICDFIYFAGQTTIHIPTTAPRTVWMEPYWSHRLYRTHLWISHNSGRSTTPATMFWIQMKSKYLISLRCAVALFIVRWGGENKSVYSIYSSFAGAALFVHISHFARHPRKTILK